MNIEPGTDLLHYRLVEKIGEGGMGVVWKAVDTTLDREVAIKVLPANLSGDAERLARFEREAKLLATLHHTNIASIFGLHETNDAPFLAMEFVPGEDLKQHLAGGAVPIDEALPIARQIARALETAHEQGIVHRDLKPANVKLTPDGKIKVLDFGLAKALEPDAGSSDSQDPAFSPTLTSAGTRAGLILGTAGYMSPEQARGKQVDRRADLWSFGVVLHEMLTGGRLFHGETISDTLAAVLRAEVDLDALPARTPSGLRRLLRRVSPSGDMVAYVSDESGRKEVYLRPFPSGMGRWQVSLEGGDFPQWSTTGDRLFYLQDEMLMFEVAVTTRPSVRLATARELFSFTAASLGPNHGYDVMPDGRFLMVQLGELGSLSGDLTLVTNWTAELEE